MRAMILEKPKKPLRLVELPMPIPMEGQLLIKVEACGVCRTDLHIIDEELPNPKLPLILGHQIVGTVASTGPGVANFCIGDRVGVPWLAKSCGHCSFCLTDQENLCEKALYTGYHLDGGFAEYCTAYADFSFPIPKDIPAINASPLLCGGLIGYRALRMTGSGKRLGFYGFGSSAHMLVQVVRYQKREVYAFTRKGDVKGQAFARELGAVWAGDSEQSPPFPLDAAIIFAPDGKLVPIALKAVDKGGVVVCAGIHMSDIPSFPYSNLWGERVLRSVANLTRQDGREFLDLASKVSIRTQVTTYPLEKANEALHDLRSGKVQGTAVIDLYAPRSS